MRADIPEETVKQATELFYSCDPIEDKSDGTIYLPISDIAKMQIKKSSVLANLNLKELETTFRLLDVNGDEKLTLEEFIDGFSQFLTGTQSTQAARNIQKRRSEEDVLKNQEMKGVITRARANSVASLAVIKQLFCSTLYNEIKNSMPKLVTEFESLVNQASKEIDDLQKSMQQLERKLESHTTAYHQSLDQAYAELDSKIRQAEEESEKRLEQRTKQLTNDWEQILEEKVEQLNEMKQKIAEINDKAEELRKLQTAEADEIISLKKENDELIEAVEEVEVSMEESKQTIEDLQTKAKQEQLKREKTDASTCKKVQLECEELMRKLDQLRDQNRRLRDERDEALYQHRTRKLTKGQSLMYEVNEAYGCENTQLGEKDELQKSIQTATVQALESGEIRVPENAIMVATEVFSDEDYEFEESLSQSVESSMLKSSIHEADVSDMSFYTDQLSKTQFEGDFESQQKIQSDISNAISAPIAVDQGLRVFRVAVVGCHSSGRTTLVNRMCGEDGLKESGEEKTKIDVRVCAVKIDGQSILLQLWDLQGDDKLFPVNQQISSKADGAIFIYDGSSMADFNQLDRQVLKIRKEVKESELPWKDTVNVLWANKWDQVDTSPTLTPVPQSSADVLKKTLNADYFEVSAKTGYNMEAAVEHLVRKLCMVQDEKLKSSRENAPESKGRSCCCAYCCIL